MAGRAQHPLAEKAVNQGISRTRRVSLYAIFTPPALKKWLTASA
jgi:hypothetical protein